MNFAKNSFIVNNKLQLAIVDKRIPKNTVECAKFGMTDQETGEMKITSYLYRRKR